jgi:CBS domain-containing membrane protein
MKVKDLMTIELFTLRPDHKLDLLDDVMSWQRIRHVPVVDPDNQLIGLVTHRDLLRVSVSSLAGVTRKDQRELYQHIQVGEIMQKDVITVGPEEDLRTAAAKMIDEKVGCLPVVYGGRLIGILTEADFLALAWEALDRKHAEKEYKELQKYSKPARHVQTS